MNDVKCPYCKHIYTTEDMEYSDHDLWAAAPNEDYVEEPCSQCGLRFMVQGGYTPEYECFKLEDVS